MKIKLTVEHKGNIPTGGWYYITEHEINIPDESLPNEVKNALNKNSQNNENLNVIRVEIIK